MIPARWLHRPHTTHRQNKKGTNRSNLLNTLKCCTFQMCRSKSKTNKYWQHFQLIFEREGRQQKMRTKKSIWSQMRELNAQQKISICQRKVIIWWQTFVRASADLTLKNNHQQIWGCIPHATFWQHETAWLLTNWQVRFVYLEIHSGFVYFFHRKPLPIPRWWNAKWKIAKIKQSHSAQRARSIDIWVPEIGIVNYKSRFALDLLILCD